MSRYWGYVIGLKLLPAFIPLLFMALPFSSTIEIMAVAVAIFGVILPTLFGGWHDFSTEKIGAIYQSINMPGVAAYCPLNRNKCDNFVLTMFLLPILLFFVVALIIVIASYYADRSNRKSFVQKKLFTLLALRSEEDLMRQKEESDSLIHLIFPKVIAKELIEEQAEQHLSPTNSLVRSNSLDQTLTRALTRVHISSGNLGRTLACMHQVSINQWALLSLSLSLSLSLAVLLFYRLT